MLDIIDIRRNLVMAEGSFPTQLQSAFRGMERASNPWGLAREKRMAWAEGLDVPTIEEAPDADVLYWVGCAASYDAGAQKTARATVQLLAEAKVSFAVLGKRECCTGDSARRAGNELLYQQMATEAVAALNEAKPKTVLASCPHCVNTIATEYPRFGGNFNVVHHTEYLAQLVDSGRLNPVVTEATVTFHDPCYLGRHRGTYEAPRSVLHVLANEYVDLPRNKDNAFCCGAGGAQFWKEEERGTERIAENRFREVHGTLGNGVGTKTLAVGCPFCKNMLASTPAAADSPIEIKDVAELLWEGVQRSKGKPDTLPVAATITQSSGSSVPVPQMDLSEATPASEEPLIVEVHPDIVSEANAMQNASPALVNDEATAVQPERIERRKWTPKSAATQSVGEEARFDLTQQEVAPLAVPPPEDIGQKAPETRRKWQPKSGKQG